MYKLLDLREEDATNLLAELFDRWMDEHGLDYDGAGIPTSDAVPSEMVILYDKNNPPMDIGTIYLIMEFKMAVWQFAINKEFDLEKSDKKRYRCYCKSSVDCLKK